MLGRILILVALVLSAAATLYYVAFSNPAESVQPPTVKVRIATAPLRTGTFLDEGDAPLTERPEWPKMNEFVTEGEGDMLGAVIIAPVAKGAPVPRSALLAPNQEGFLAAVLSPGMRAASIGVDAVSGNAGHIFPGDRIDVLLTQQADREGRRDWATETILRNVRVIAVDQRLSENPAKRSAESVARTITLEVSPRDAERLALANNLGRLSLSLRSFVIDSRDDDATDHDDGPVWSGDISTVIRDAQEIAAPDAPAIATPRATPTAPAAPQPERPVQVLRGATSSKVTPVAPTDPLQALNGLGGLGPDELQSGMPAGDAARAMEALRAMGALPMPEGQ